MNRKRINYIAMFCLLFLVLVSCQASALDNEEVSQAGEEPMAGPIESTPVTSATETPIVEPTTPPTATVVATVAQPTTTPEASIAEAADTGRDAQTGLPLNPVEFPEGDFVVEGPVKSVFTVPMDEPAFMVHVTGREYLIVSQPLNEIRMADGSTLLPTEYKNGMVVRATVRQTGEFDVFGYPILASDDLVVLAKSE